MYLLNFWEFVRFRRFQKAWLGSRYGSCSNCCYGYYLRGYVPDLYVCAVAVRFEISQHYRFHTRYRIVGTDVGNDIEKKFTPGLYSSLGIYLPLVTTNCAILGIAKLVTAEAAAGLANFSTNMVVFGKLVKINMAMSFGEAVLSGLFYGLGFTLAIVLLSGLRQKLIDLTLQNRCADFL